MGDTTKHSRIPSKEISLPPGYPSLQSISRLQFLSGCFLSSLPRAGLEESEKGGDGGSE